MTERLPPPNHTVPVKAEVDSCVVKLISATHVAEMSAPEPPPLVPGFELMGEIGRGGMAVVYQARDQTLGRVVALKVLQSVYLATDSAVAQRFVEEARITSQLQHPGIPPIYQVGVLSDGRPYLAMKFVKGETLEAKIERGEQVNHLAIMEAVAQAVGFAHAHGIIHRDLKPQNIMIGAFGEVQVMDWGLAKLKNYQASTPGEEATKPHTTTISDPRVGLGGGQTAMGSVLGTPAYMAPEQAAGELDKIGPHTDVFGLGAVWCSILTGQPPFTGELAHEVAIKSLRGQTGEAFARLDASGAEPAVIALCKRCLAFDPRERPADANAVAAEISTLRRAAEERARQAEIEETKARVFAAEQRKRRRVWVGLAVVLLFGALISSGLTIWALAAQQQVAAERDRVQLALQQVAAERDAREMQRRRAEEQEQLARTESQRAAERETETRAVLDFVIHRILAAARPKDTHGGLGHDVKLIDAINQAVPFIEHSFVNQPLIEARLRRTLGMSFFLLGRQDQAREQMERSLKLFRDKLGEDHPDTLGVANDLGICYAEAGLVQEAFTLHQATWQRRRERLGDNHRLTLRSMTNVANCLEKLGRTQEALDLHQQALQQRTQAFGANDPEVIWSKFNVANCLQKLGHVENAAVIYEELARVQIASADSESPEKIENLKSNLATNYARRGRHDEALRLRQSLLSDRMTRLGADHPQTLEAQMSVGSSLLALGRYAEAVKLLAETLAVQRIKLGSNHPQTLATMHTLADGYYTLGHYADACKLFLEAVQGRQAKLGADHPDTLRSIKGLASCYASMNQHSEALKLREEVYRLQKAKLGEDHPDTLSSLINLANSYADMGHHEKALALREQTLAMTRQKLGNEHRLTWMAMTNLANSYVLAGRHEEGLKLRQEVLRVQQARLGSDHPDTLLSMGNLANSYGYFGRHQEAMNLRRDVQRLLRNKLGPDHPETLRAMHNLAASLFAIGNKAEAVELFEKTLTQMRARFGTEHPDYLATAASFARILVTVEDSSLHDWRRAAELASFVTSKRPRDTASWSTLALAHYYGKSWRELIAAVNKVLSQQASVGLQGEAADKVVNAFLLVIAYWHLDEPGEARKWLMQAIEWLEAEPALKQRIDLLRWREEAESLLNAR